MNKRTFLLASAATWTALLSGCVIKDNSSEPHIPLLEELAGDVDGSLDVVDRTVALDGAQNHDIADIGAAIDMGGISGGFLMDVNSEDIQNLDDPDATFMPSYNNVWTASTLATLADIATNVVVGPPSAAVAITTAGEITQYAPNVWVATNTIDGPDGGTVTGTFVAAWVGVGWLAEMRLSSSNGAYDNTLWFNGFLSNDGNLGWWDLYDGTQVVGVVEWIDDGAGNAQSGIASVHGPDAGDVLSYWTIADGEVGVFYHDAGLNEDAWVLVNPDESGELRLHDYNSGEPACWDIDFADAACPE